MNKKGDGLAIIVTVVLVLIIVVAILVLLEYKGKIDIFPNKKEEPSKTVEIPKVKLLLKARDSNTGKIISANYSLEYNNNQIKTGFLRNDTWNEVEIKLNESWHLWCWKDNQYYANQVILSYLKSVHEFCNDGIDNNLNGIIDEEPCDTGTNIYCDIRSIGTTNITHSGEIKKGNTNSIKINISSDSHLRGIHLCTRWSTGIIYANFPDYIKTCDSIWRNYSKYYPNNKSYDYLPKGIYHCEAKAINETCTFVDGKDCILPSEIPEGYNKKVDSCWYTSSSLYNSTFTTELRIKASNLFNAFDYVDIYVIDRDLYKTQNIWLKRVSVNGKDLGAIDSIYRLT